MRELIIEGQIINDENHYIIAEIGGNHGGDVEKCKRLIDIAVHAGCNAVKLQKRDNKALMTKALYSTPYNSENAFGATYGEHRESLEFNAEQWTEIQRHCGFSGITMFATAFDIPSVRFLEDLDVPAFKIASADITNLPLIDEALMQCMPLIVSTGGCTQADIDRAYKHLKGRGCNNFAFLHAVASYPNRDEQLNLALITHYRERYPDIVIGFSNHHQAVWPNYAAYCMGARIFEVHITDNRAQKGTDHAFSLEPHGLEVLCQDMARLKTMIGSAEKSILPDEVKPIQKMGKSIWPAYEIPAGKMLTPFDVEIKCPGGGMPPYEFDDLIGHRLISAASTDVPLSWGMIQ